MEKNHLKFLIDILKTFGLKICIANYLLYRHPIDYIFTLRIHKKYLSTFTCQILIFLWLQKLIEHKIVKEDDAEVVEAMLDQRISRLQRLKYKDYKKIHHKYVKKLTSFQELEEYIKMTKIDFLT